MKISRLIIVFIKSQMVHRSDVGRNDASGIFTCTET